MQAKMSDLLQFDELATGIRLRLAQLGEQPSNGRRSNGAGARRTLCQKCDRPQNVCICHALPETPRDGGGLHLIVIQHPAESARKTISSVPLLPRCIKNVTVLKSVQSSEAGAQHKKTQACEVPPGLCPALDVALQRDDTVLLFPGKGSVDVKSLATETEIPAARQRVWKTIIAIDGTWRQAKIILNNNPRLTDGVARAFVDRDAPGAYGFRKEPDRYTLSTAEACVEAMGALAIPGERTDGLLAVVSAFHELVRLQSQFLPEHYAERREAKDLERYQEMVPDSVTPAARGRGKHRTYGFFVHVKNPDGTVSVEQEDIPVVPGTYSQAAAVRDRVNNERKMTGNRRRVCIKPVD